LLTLIKLRENKVKKVINKINKDIKTTTEIFACLELLIMLDAFTKSNLDSGRYCCLGLTFFTIDDILLTFLAGFSAINPSFWQNSKNFLKADNLLLIVFTGREER